VIGEAQVTQQIINLAKGEEILTSSSSIKSIDEDLKESTHPVDTVEAEAWNGKLEVYFIPWEEDEKATVFSESVDTYILHHATLILNYKGRETKMDEVNSHLTVGRGEENDLMVPEKFSSRIHAEIVYRHGRFNLCAKSTNGTIMIDKNNNMKRIHREEYALHGQGKICFGDTQEMNSDTVVTCQCEQ